MIQRRVRMNGSFLEGLGLPPSPLPEEILARASVQGNPAFRFCSLILWHSLERPLPDILCAEADNPRRLGRAYKPPKLKRLGTLFAYIEVLYI